MRTIADDAGRSYRFEIDLAAVRKLKADGVCRLDRLDVRSLNEILSDLIESTLLPIDMLWTLCRDELIQAGCRSADDVEKVFGLEKLFAAAAELGEEVLAFSLSRDRTGAVSGLARTFRTATKRFLDALKQRSLAVATVNDLPEAFFEAALSDDETAQRVALATIANPLSSGNTSGASPDTPGSATSNIGASADSATPPVPGVSYPRDTPQTSATPAETSNEPSIGGN